jgi:hypothetical protein
MMNPATAVNNNCHTGLDPVSHPHLRVIENFDLDKRIFYRIARIIYAETRAASLAEVEALASMVANAKRAGASLEDLSEDKLLFECLDKDSARHGDLMIRYDSPALQMCLRTLSRALTGILRDTTRGATRFHRAEMLPSWATDIGSISETGNLHFYR